MIWILSWRVHTDHNSNRHRLIHLSILLIVKCDNL
jgi:hypothetical protein